ncbi:MAG: DNA polymerase III subunit beta [Minisyncoccus archaeiphilus]|jgi:DNA polymerase-3 subunit beta|uniref:DNA polymerase III subunit beta n=1 Tax=Minisyncoccus archaeiphilus TaxID=3238481 RepID=UPI0009D3904F|nr:MAG: DNA polymerase III subunit beta [Parcubacteria group bacterium ADurb.Bin216]GMX59145.1 MAG: DNA polymerase III subunit beta [Candidatus Parcubacteria bacterium]
MNFTILTKDFKKGISITERVTGKNMTLPILDNLLIESDKNFIKISATDLELGIEWWGRCITQEEGKIAVPAKLLSQVIGSLVSSEEKVSIKEKSQSLIIETEKKFKTNIKGFSPEDFPIIPSFQKDYYIEIDGKKIKDALSSVVDIANISNIRPEISGVYMCFTKDSVRFVATDSFRLAEKNIKFGENADYINNFDKDQEFIIPQKAIKELVSIIPDDGRNLKIYTSESQLLFEICYDDEHPEIDLISRQIEGQYPAYQEIIPKSAKTKIVINKDEFLKQVKTAGIFGGRTNEISVKIDNSTDEVEITSQDSELGESNQFLPAQIEGNNLKVSFNWKFLIDGLQHIKSSEISFEFQGSEGPAVIRGIGDDSYLYMVMPIKL